MKLFKFSILAAALACGLANAQTAYTTPVGYATTSLLTGFNALGLTLQMPSLAAGDFETVDGSDLTDNQLAFTPTTGRTYILEIVEAANAAAVGIVQEIAVANINGTTITTPDDLSGLLATGDKYILRVAPTLEEIFTTVPLASGGVLGAALSSGSADIVWIPTGSGGYDQYYLRSGATPEFRNVTTNTASPNVPLIYADGFLIEKKAPAVASLTVTGEVKSVGTNSVAAPGFNLLSSVAPVGLNLFNAGFEATLTPALSAGSADIVWVQQPNLSYVQYFRRSGSGAGWRVAGTTTTLTQAEAEAVNLSLGFLIERKSAPSININLQVPTSYDNL